MLTLFVYKPFTDQWTDYIGKNSFSGLILLFIAFLSVRNEKNYRALGMKKLMMNKYSRWNERLPLDLYLGFLFCETLKSISKTVVHSWKDYLILRQLCREII